MNIIVRMAYKAIFGIDPLLHEVAEWEAARDILNCWNVPKLGEDLAKKFIFRVVNHTLFPDIELTREIVGMAEDKGVELFPEMGDIDPHMDVYAHLERKYLEGQNGTEPA